MKVSQVFLDEIAVSNENKTDFQVVISVFKFQRPIPLLRGAR